MPKVSPEHMQARRNQISLAAVQQFSIRGIHSTSMANIVEASGLSAGAIYTHFSGKHEIIAYVAEQTFNSLFSGVEAIANALPIPDPDELLQMISASISGSTVPSGMIVQIWGEAATNQSVSDAVNIVYERALSVINDYYVRWLSKDGSHTAAEVETRALPLAQLLVSIIYAQILQLTLIRNYDAKLFANQLTEITKATS